LEIRVSTGSSPDPFWQQAKPCGKGEIHQMGDLHEFKFSLILDLSSQHKRLKVSMDKQ